MEQTPAQDGVKSGASATPMLDEAQRAMSEVSSSLGSLFSSTLASATTPGSARGGALAPSSSSRKPAAGGQRPEDIPREELMHLCMKMNKRMQSMETKISGLARIKTALLRERKALLDHVRETTPKNLVEALPDPASAISLHVAPREDESMTLDLPALTMLRMQYDNTREQQLVILNKRVKDIQLAGTGAGTGECSKN